MAAAVALRLLFLAFCIMAGMAEGRFLKLNSSCDRNLISDGADHNVKENLALPTDSSNSPSFRRSACDHQYGFLPCADNAVGYAFLIFVYKILLVEGQKQIGIGSKVLFNIFGVGKIGGIVFRILMSLPSMIFMIVSGVFSSHENAQSQVSVGVSIYTGITVFSLTVQWGICVISGARSLVPKPHKNADDGERLSILREKGVLVDKETRPIAWIVLLSLIPYVVVQFIKICNTSSQKHVMTLIALIVSSLSLIAYFIHQVLHPLIQERSLEYSKYEILQAGFVHQAQRLFDLIDADDDKQITKAEMEAYVRRYIKDNNMQVDERAVVSEILELFNLNADSSCITEEELIEKLKILNDEVDNIHSSASRNIVHNLFLQFERKKENLPEVDQVAVKILKCAESRLRRSESFTKDDGKPRMEQIQSRFKRLDSHGRESMSASEQKQLITNVEVGEYQPRLEDIDEDLSKYFDKNNDNMINESEYVEGLTELVKDTIRVAITPDGTAVSLGTIHQIWEVIYSVVRLIAGIVLMTFLGGPLMVSILQLSYTVKCSSFIISFVIVPLAMNVRPVTSALLLARKKNQRTASVTFTEIYGGVIMNNIAGLTTLLVIVYAKNLTFDFSAEILTVTLVCGAMGVLACSRTTYRLWTCILAFFLYPFSLGLYYFWTLS